MKLFSLFMLFGIDLKKMVRSIAALPGFFSDYKRLKAELASDEGAMKIGRLYPVLLDKTDSSGTATGHYFHQDLLVAQKVFGSGADRVVDIGSRVDGFVAHVAAFRKIEVVDIRDLHSDHDNIDFLQCDFMDKGSTQQLGQSDLVTCLHVLEHFGLGRYGDPIVTDGHIRGLRNLERLVSDGGRLIVSVPIGRPRIEFNAHRIFSSGALASLISDDFALADFAFVDDHGDLHTGVDLAAHQAELDKMHFGCGIYDFRRTPPGGGQAIRGAGRAAGAEAGQPVLSRPDQTLRHPSEAGKI
ncbi:MAG: DUF268 domain-containing protein [Roseicyclus sp.]|nr:DUF268 domain-containing protein [Roseicyclus sp.]